MKFPKLLFQNKRKIRSSECIRNWNYLYTRHKPSTNWNKDENLPDFSQIKLDQSLNWCNYSIPAWVRFNDGGDYLSDYAVAGFKADTIRNEHLKSESFPKRVLHVNHKPIEMNYSHCELLCIEKLSKSKRRELRMSLRHNCIVPLLPGEEFQLQKYPFEIIKMYFRRFSSIIKK